jgi:hypothetical protein
VYPALVPPARKEVMTASRALKAVQVPLDAQACLVKVTACEGGSHSGGDSGIAPLLLVKGWLAAVCIEQIRCTRVCCKLLPCI